MKKKKNLIYMMTMNKQEINIKIKEGMKARRVLIFLKYQIEIFKILQAQIMKLLLKNKIFIVNL